MSGLDIQITSNSADIAARFRDLAQKLRNQNAANKAIAVQLFGDMQRNFQNQGSVFGEPWAPLAPSTARYKARHGWSPLAMLRTGFLRGTAYSNATDSYAAVGYSASYASYHDDDDTKYVPGNKIPRRRLLPPRPYAYQRGVQIYEWYVKKSIDEARL